MTIALTGAGGLFTRLGHIGGILNSLNTYRSTPSGTLPTKFTTLLGDYLTTDRKYVDSLVANQSAWQNANAALPNYLRSLAQATLTGMADADQAQPDASVATAMAYLIGQMQTNTNTVKRATLGASSATGRADGTSNNGNATLVLSTKTANGLPLENLIPEVIYLTCTSDSQNGTGGTAVGSEVLTVAGERAQSNLLNWDWPVGSGCAGALTVIDPQLDAQSSGNLLTNSDFETFTVANTPDDWPIATGSAGTTVFSDTTAYLGSKNLKITGNGAELTALTQLFGAAAGSGTVSTLKPLTQYAVSLWIRVSAVPAAGVLRVALWDGSAVINDAQGTANSFNITLTAATISYVNYTGSFRTPALLPTSQYLQLKLTTALENAKSVLIDALAMAPSTPLYQQGLYANAFRGATKLLVTDRYAITTTNDFGGASAGASFQSLFDRLFDMRSLKQLLPSASSPSISDGLIT